MPMGLGVASALKARPPPAWDVPCSLWLSTPWTTQQSSATQRTTMVTDPIAAASRSLRLHTNGQQYKMAHRGIGTLIGCLRGMGWLQGPERGQGPGLPDWITRHTLGLGSVKASLWPRATGPHLNQSPRVPRARTLCLRAAVWWARMRGCAFGCGLAAVPEGRMRASLTRWPHHWYPCVVYSEECTAQENPTVIFRKRPSMYHRIEMRGVGSGFGSEDVAERERS